MTRFLTIEKMPELVGKRVLLRVDFNVPVVQGRVLDDFRIRRVIPTIHYLARKGAQILLVSHIGRSDNTTLVPVYEYLKKQFPIVFLKSFFDERATQVLHNLENGSLVLFENVRHDKGEERNDPAFGEKLASIADYYVNEAFSVSHRAHASIVGVPQHLPSFAGLLFDEEVKNLSRAFDPEHPFVFILGGAKFETKLPLVQKFLSTADSVFVGGALANDLFKVHGFEVGKSLLSEFSHNDELSHLLENKGLHLPTDVIVKRGEKTVTTLPHEILPDDYIVDAGEKTLEQLSRLTASAKFILWNGPLGNYENGFKEGTHALARIVGKSNGATIIGGGDTLAAIAELGIGSKFSFVSTGGGAMLDFLAHNSIPGVDALSRA